MRNQLSILAAVASLFCFAASAAEWYVSPDGTDADGRGAEAAPFRTIDYAIGKASADDTIILLPGDHIEGSSNSNRATVNKKLTIRSKNGRASRDTTRIVGAYATGGGSSDPVGIGTGAIRGLSFSSASSGSRVEGITFYRGSAGSESDNTNFSDCGGGALVSGDSTKVDFVDCAFVECRARRGGGLYHNKANAANLQAVRCLFKNCADLKFGSAMRGGAAYFCVFDGNCLARSVSGGTSPSTVFDTGNGSPAFSYGYRAINCTFVNNQRAGLVVDGPTCFNGGIYNNLFQRNLDGDYSYGVQFKSTSSFDTLVSNGWVDALTNQISATSKINVFSPFDGDYRLTADSSAIGTGSAARLESIPEEFRYTDYNGETIDPAGTINAGAVQEALTESASGVSFTDNAYGTWTFDGETISVGFGGTWKGSIGWPVPQHLGFIPKEGRALVRFTIGETPIWPLRDDTAWFHPSRIGIAQGANVVTTTNIFYADPVNGSDDTGDGSEANPYKTLNKAVHKTTVSFVVRAKAGDYCTAEESYAKNKNRVVVPATLAGNLRVVAVEGPENTFISGASDDTSNGTGANAVRCIAVASTNKYYAAFQGFTLRNGRTGKNDDTTSNGAALRNINDNPNDLGTGVLLDCVVTNCSGNRGATIDGGSAYRCRFYDCKTFNGGGQCVLRHCSVLSSSFTGCGGKSQLFGNTAKGYNCTIYGSVGDAPQSIYNNGSGVKGYLYNCVSGRPSGTDIGSEPTDDQLVNTLYCRMAASNPNTFTTAVKEDPLKLLDAAAGDYRLLPDSAGAWLASTAYLKSCMDIDGKPFAFKDDRYQAGCYSMRGSTLYVDAVGGNDASDGSSEVSAFRTLAVAMNAADYGDTVIALPGTYDSGTAIPTQAESCYTAAPTLPARVVVKGGVTLESRDGAEATVIKGAASTSSGRSDGCGDGAVRGVFLCAGATLRGFTVTGGRTLYQTTGSIDTMGGGVCGAYDSTDGSAMQWRGLVENCILSNNVARSGGGAQYGTYRNCRFFGNTTYNLGYGLCRAFAEGCVFKGNGSGHSTLYDCKVVNCTVLGGQASNNGLVCNEGNADYLPIFNSIVLGNYKTGVMTNCCFLIGAKNKATVTPREYGNITGDASIVDADGKPVADAAVIDAGDASFCSAALLAGRDVAGVRRVLNGAIDIGAFEYDWGVPWAKTLGGRRLVIDDMPSNAALVGNRLMFADGTVSMTWEKGRSNAPYIYNVRVIGNGTLTVTVNGEAVGSYTSADGARELRFASALAANALQFAYVPGDGDTGGAELYGFNHSNWYISFR